MYQSHKTPTYTNDIHIVSKKSRQSLHLLNYSISRKTKILSFNISMQVNINQQLVYYSNVQLMTNRFELSTFNEIFYHKKNIWHNYDFHI